MGQGLGKSGYADWDGGVISKSDAEHVLMGCNSGDFLVRMDPSSSQIILSISQPAGAVHFNINRSDAGFTLGADAFPSVGSLLDEVQKRGIQTRDNKIVFKNAVGGKSRHLSRDANVSLASEMAPWFAGIMRKQDAEKIVLANSSGDYLVRMSKDKAFTFYLVINDEGSPLQLPIERSQKSEYTFGMQTFPNIGSLISTIQKVGLRNGALHLRTPLGAQVTSQTSAPQRQASSRSAHAAVDEDANDFVSESVISRAVSSNSRQMKALVLDSDGRSEGDLGPSAHQTSDVNDYKDAPWYAGAITKEEAQSVLLQHTTGDYLVRQSTQDTALFYLVVNDTDTIVQFRISFEDGKYTLGPISTESLAKLVRLSTIKPMRGKAGMLTLQNPVGGRKPEALYEAPPKPSFRKVEPPPLPADRRRDHASEDTEPIKDVYAQVDKQRSRSPARDTAAEAGYDPQSIKDVYSKPNKPVAPSLPPRMHLASTSETEEAETESGEAHSSTSDPINPLIFSSRGRSAPQSSPTPPEVPQRTMSKGVSSPSKLAIADDSIYGMEEEAKPALKCSVMPLNEGRFKRLSKHPTFPTDLPAYARGGNLNRFFDILPNPRTRVVLPVLKGDPTTEYINANFIRSFDGRNPEEYIAAQAPKKSGVYNFLRMMLEKRVCTILMVTDLIEGGKIKCERYWPRKVSSKPKDALVVGDISVNLEHEAQEDMYKRSLLTITRKKESISVMHYWCNKWPDHGAPTAGDGTTLLTQPILDMLVAIRDYRSITNRGQGPLLVHCSAGIGRTGTAIIMDMAMSALQAGMRIDVNDLIDKAREDRMALVQRVIQYKFLYQACIDYAKKCTRTEEAVAEPMYAFASSEEEMQKFAKSASWAVKTRTSKGVVYELVSGFNLEKAPEDMVAVFESEQKEEEAEEQEQEQEQEQEREAAKTGKDARGAPKVTLSSRTVEEVEVESSGSGGDSDTEEREAYMAILPGERGARSEAERLARSLDASEEPPSPTQRQAPAPGPARTGGSRPSSAVFTQPVVPPEATKRKETARKTKKRSLQTQLWYKGDMPRTAVDQALARAPKGTFIVRDSSVPGNFAMSLREESKISNMLIVPVAEGGVTKYKLGAQGNALFDDVVDLVRHFARVGILTDQKGETTRLIISEGEEEEGEEEDEDC